MNQRYKTMFTFCLSLLLVAYLALLTSSSTPQYYLPSPPPPRPSNLTQQYPGAIIIGVRKGGTRALLEFLGQHSRVVTAHDEMHFFDKDEEYSKGLDYYRSHMPFAEPNQLTIEKTPAYFVNPDAPARIRYMNPRIRLLLIVRDPVIRLLSDYTQILSSRTAKNLSFARFEDLVIDPYSSEINIGYKAVNISIYQMHYRRWLKHFPRSQIHIVDGDALIGRPASELAAVERFLGLEPELTDRMFYFNETKGFYCMRRGGSGEEHCLGAAKGRKHPEVDPRVLDRLRRFYAPHNRDFFELCGRTFDWPGR